MTDITSLDSGFDAPDGVNHSAEAGVHIRVTMPEDPSFQMIVNIRPLDLVWTLKNKVLDNITQKLRDSMNYGLYCPPSNMRVGKYLDEERPIKEYPLSVPIGLLEFKYKRKIYKVDINPLKLKKMHAPTELKTFLDLVSQGKVDEINAKLNRGFDPNFNSVGKGETPLTLAATLTRPGAVILALVGGGAFIDFRNKKGLTPLHVATEVGNKDAVRILLDLGSSPNYKDADGLTPLCYATRKDSPAVCIQWLLQERADIGQRDKKGWMEIHYACEHGLTQHLEQLLYYGADRNAQTSDTNDTPLHICARFNQGECARLLLIRGADKSLENKSKQDAAQVALASGHENVANIISNFRPEQVELFSDIPKYNEKRRGTISMATLHNLQRSRSNPNLLQQLFQQDSVLSATVSQAGGVQYVSNGLIPNGVRSSGPHVRPAATDLFGTGANGFAKTESSSTQNHVERVIDLHRGSTGFGFVLRGPLDPPGSTLNFLPTSDIPARQYIESVDPGSVAEKAGLVAGDFILEINDQSVIISSHKECVKLMRSGGDLLRLKVIRVQHPGTLRVQPKQTTHNGGIVEIHPNGTDSVKTNSLTSTDAANAQSALSGLEALENLDAALNNFDQTASNSSGEDQMDTSETPPVPAEFSSETTSLDDGILIAAPSTPVYDNQVETVETDFPVPPPVLNEEVIAVLHANERLPDGPPSALSEPEHHASVVIEPEADREQAASELVKPTEGHVAEVVAVSGIVAVELKKEEVTVDSPRRKGSHESTGKDVTVESAKEVTIERKKNGSDEKFNEGTSGKRAVSLAYAVGNEDNRKSVINPQSKKTEVTSNRKSYAAPNPPQQSKSTPSPTIAPTKVAVVAVAAASVKDEENRNTILNDNHVDVQVTSTPPSKNTVPQAPPLPPPLPPPSFGTLSRSNGAPPVTDGPKSPSNGHKILEEARKREDYHATLMAAVLKRKNVVDSTDGDQLADSIDARINHTRTQQKIVYRADHTKEVKLPPVAAVGLLEPAEGTLSPKKEDDSPGFRAEAEKMRQAFLLKKTVTREASKQPETTQAHSEEEKKPTVDVKASSTNGTLPPREDAKTSSDNRTINRPKSAVVNPQPVLADVAAIIAQKALARQKREAELKVDEPKVDEIKPKIVEAESKVGGAELKVAEASPQISSAAVFEKATIADRRSVFESGTLKPTVSATLPKNSTSKATENINGSISPEANKSQQSTVANQQSKVYGASVTSPTTLQTSNHLQDSTATLPNTKLGNGKPTNRNSHVYTSYTVAAPAANAPRNRNSSVYPSSPPVAAETPATMKKSSHQITTLPTGAKATSVKTSVDAPPPFIPPPVEFATPTEAGFTAEVHATATLRNNSKSSQSNSVVFRAKSSVGSDQDPADPAKTTFRNRSIVTWSEEDVEAWLKSFDYTDYQPLFAEKKVTGQVLAQMKSNELEAMGISNMLHRTRIEREIRSAVARK